MRVLIVLFSAAALAGCSQRSPTVEASTTSTSSPHLETSTPPTVVMTPPSGSATPGSRQVADTAMNEAMEASAPLLENLGGTYRCDQRAYPPPHAPHISAWEWAFSTPPDAPADRLGSLLHRARRDGLVFRFMTADNKVAAVVEGAMRARARCWAAAARSPQTRARSSSPHVYDARQPPNGEKPWLTPTHRGYRKSSMSRPTPTRMRCSLPSARSRNAEAVFGAYFHWPSSPSVKVTSYFASRCERSFSSP